jgi:hypothetical protein
MTEQPEQTDAQPDAQPDEQSDEGQEDSSSTEQLDEGEPGDIGDAQLPADLQPTEDNPLARHPGQSGDEDDAIGSDREGDPETAPLTEDEADYGDSSST